MRCADPSINQLLREFLDANTGQTQLREDWKELASGRRILELDGREQLQMLFAAAAELFEQPSLRTFGARIETLFRLYAAKGLISHLLRKPLAYAETDLQLLIGLGADRRSLVKFPLSGLLRVVFTQTNKANEVSPALRKVLRTVRGELHRHNSYFGKSKVEKETEIIDQILGETNTQSLSLDLHPGEAWSGAAIADLGHSHPEQRAKWMDLLLHARSAEGTRPSRKWLKSAANCVGAIGRPEFCRCVASWLSLVEKPRTQLKPAPQGRFEPDPNLLIEQGHAAILKGLAWCCIGIDDALLARSLGDAACAAFKKVPMVGPRCVKLGNAAVIALSEMPGIEPAAQLGRLSANVKHASSRGYVAKGLDHIARRTGQTAEDLSELAVPTFDLRPEGKLLRTLGPFTAEIEIVAGDEVELHWKNAAGKVHKSVPAEIRRDHPGPLKELNRTVKDIRRMLPAQRVRLERLLMGRRQWSLEDWRHRYADHPLIAHLSRRLIWEFPGDGKTTTAIACNGTFLDSEDEPVVLTPLSQVRLWHPIRSTVQQVLAWRAWLERHQVTQPFKQAHREIYVLTDAETQTASYSNRFAAHILRQHQFAALAQARGWTYRLQGAFDSHNTPTLRLPQHDLRVEYWVEPINEHQMTESGIFTHVSTDQLRFFQLNSVVPMNLVDVDPLLFTEIMRHIDLFVGVASVGNDPQWQDAGSDRLGRYWHSYCFGELAESAKTRKAVLERLIPRLNIAERCSFVDRFLVVRGDLHTYKIHLGSGNILFGGNDQYLCIVPDRGVGARDHLFLPFEGDATLSIIISKAFLLAEDGKIKDPSITRQIRR